MNSNDWKNMLVEVGIEDNKIEKILSYIENHVDYELATNKELKFADSSLSIAIRVLSKIDLTDVNFIKLDDRVRTNVLTFEFNDEINETELHYVITNEIVRLFEQILKSGKKINLFLIASEIKVVDGVYYVFNRFYIN